MSKFGWRPDTPDMRDWSFAEKFGIVAELPRSADLRPNCSPVEDQGNLGSCTANALVGALEYLEVVHQRKALLNLSRLFVYYGERVLENSVKSDAGAELRDGIKTLVTDGVCSEKTWPYIIERFAKTPSKAAYKQAQAHKVAQYARIRSLAEMKSSLAQGIPFVFGFACYESIESPDTARTGIINLPQPGERMVGGHAVLAVGYSDDNERVIFRNSWGTNWGAEGYGNIPYAYLTNTSLAGDMWAIQVAKGL